MTVTKEKALEALLSSKSIKEASEKSKISERALYKYLNEDKEFLATYRELRANTLRSIADRIGDKAIRAVDILVDIMEHSEKEYTRLRACGMVLDYHLKALELVDFEERLREIEKCIAVR